MTVEDWHYQRFEAFTNENIKPYAEEWDIEAKLPDIIIQKLVEKKYLGTVVPKTFDGPEFSAMELGLLCSALGSTCSSVRSLITVHSMVCQSINRWGSEDIKSEYLPSLCNGNLIAAFALSEETAGSDITKIKCSAVKEGSEYILNGSKRWTTFGALANLFLVFAQTARGPIALLVPKEANGFSVTPLSNIMGIRASDTAALEFSNVRIPETLVLGRPGFGISAVALPALELGRLTVAFGCLGMISACLRGSLKHSQERETFGKKIIEHQLIAAKISKMGTDRSAASHLCLSAAKSYDQNDSDASRRIWTAKYFTSTAASKAASDYIQILGARGFERDHECQRIFRDSKVMEIIEGSTELQEISIAEMLRSDPNIYSLCAEFQKPPKMPDLPYAI